MRRRDAASPAGAALPANADKTARTMRLTITESFHPRADEVFA